MLFGRVKTTAPKTGGTPKIAAHHAGAKVPFGVRKAPARFAQGRMQRTGVAVVRGSGRVGPGGRRSFYAGDLF